jgi:hypothetical protein
MMKPIRYNRRQLSLMVTVARHFDSRSTISWSEGRPAKIAHAFGLRKSGKGFSWEVSK